jgi:hypothetical protein
MLVADIALARRLEMGHITCTCGCADVAARLNPASGATALAVAGGYGAFTGPGSPINQAAALGLHRPVTDADIDQLEAFFRDRGSPVQIEITPYVDQSLPDILCRRGYRISEFTTVLACELPVANDSVLRAAEVEVAPATASDAEELASVMGKGFAEGQEPPPEHVAMGKLFVLAPNVTAFFARIGGEPAGGGAMMIKDGLATINGASTLPKFRCRGVQTALLLARLAHATAAGCTLASTSTHPGTVSQRNAERVGFRIVYTRIALIREWK